MILRKMLRVAAMAWILAAPVANCLQANESSTNTVAVEELGGAEKKENEHLAGVAQNAPELPKPANILEEKGAETGAKRFASLSQKQLYEQFQGLVESARRDRLGKAYDDAEKKLTTVLESGAPDEIKRGAMLEFAFLKHEQGEWQKAQKLYSEYAKRYPKDPSLPEVYLRQAYIYREMGVPNLALSKLYAVISTCLSLRLEEMEYYQKLVRRAQGEIAETHYLQGQLEEAADYLQRLLKIESPDINRAEILYKLARCQSGMGNHAQVVATARLYLEKYASRADAPEMRFFLANALKKLGRNNDALKEILVLLQTQQENAKSNPQLWLYWQQRAGNDIANQLYREGDYMSALQVYLSLVGLNKAPEWQIPVWYQIGLIYENLKQNPKAAEMYDQILARSKELAGEKNPTLQAIVEMAAWRKQYLGWEDKARLANRQFEPEKTPAIGN